MARVAVDFGTGNTVLAKFNESLQQAETLSIPGISTEFRYRLAPGQPERVAHVVPSLIYYSEKETLIGDQVLSRGLAEHPETFRWMKRGIASRITKVRKTAQGHKNPAQAGEDFLSRLLEYGSDQFSLRDDTFTFTAPTEAFEDFQDWLRKVAEKMGIVRLRLLDEPTACVLGYDGAARRDDRFLVSDFGCGTYDVSAVRIDLSSEDARKAVQLGGAGLDRGVGGMDIDQWLADDFCGRHQLQGADRAEIEGFILRQAEGVKIALSDPAESEAMLQVVSRAAGRGRVLQTNYRRSCDACERGQAGVHAGRDESCLGCLLRKHEFVKKARETLDRALENAALKSGMRRDDLAKVLVTGGTSLVPCVRAMLLESFGNKAVLANPFDAVARGACGDLDALSPILQHDYSIESYNSERKEFEFAPLFRLGTEYPTDPQRRVKLWARGSYDGMTRIALKVFEVSRMKRHASDMLQVDARGILEEISEVKTEYAHILINGDNPTFIVADPPVDLKRDTKRFLCSFRVDGHRRLLVTVRDLLRGGDDLLNDFPVVRL